MGASTRCWLAMSSALALAACGNSDVPAGDAGLKDVRTDDVNRFCEAGTCFIGSGSVCEVPTGGALEAGCCECTGDYCSRICICAAYDTPIATPTGDRPIASLAVGDLVYSADHGALRAVPIRETSSVRVEHHVMVRVTLANGTVLRISPGHPTAEGTTFGTLAKGDKLDQLDIVDVERVPYDYPMTFDILPDSDTGTYVAGGALVGSTLAGLPHTRP